ncbi:uroporphyrinogen-III C-methyltransferase [Aquamicrobium sp. LC103]|uniref:uroporphyrinogen-III C-methyltransferase n=1 Tax=Aquamicrobium sp. LC103 TaxID=1120658 RepID=UPI00063E98C9|nr:uroporphyrinogen-III C-methyltransferase [Aquamicrobium sp. LC103]TKT76691.1 uroporphyrinogen-III C-methyltransferase [Aquamicrobium sp. LC103]
MSVVQEAIARLIPHLTPFEPGHVWLAGAGPGNAGCLTLDVIHALASADAVVYDALVEPSVVETARSAQLVHAGKRGGKASASQDEITGLLIELARQGKRVLRLKGGDPFVFGRGGEEALALARAGIGFRILPGVTSALGALASAGIPATMRGTNKAIILATGHAAGGKEDVDWAALAKTGEPILVYMGMSNLARITDALTRGGLTPSTPAALIMSATTPQERVLISSLGSLAAEASAHGFESPAIIVVGEIVRMRSELLGLARQVEAG